MKCEETLRNTEFPKKLLIISQRDLAKKSKLLLGLPPAVAETH